MPQEFDFLILAGPTASGKSGLAIQIADQMNGEIINADSMQVYKDLSILTARPSENPVSHHLYGVLTAQEMGSAAWWQDQALGLIQDCLDRSKLPILVGGTGLYLHTLTHGLSSIPTIDPAVRQKVRQLCVEMGEDFSEYVYGIDPLLRGHINPSDPQRLSRALEVFLQTDQSFLTWRGNKGPLHSFRHRYVVIDLERTQLYEQINKRFHLMVEQGAIQEVETLRKLDIPEGSPLLKAIGVPEISDYLDGQLTLEAAIEKAQQSTRNYAKRQMTWFRQQVSKKIVLSEAHLDTLLKKLTEVKGEA